MKEHKVMVVMHGYGQNVPEGYMPWKYVVKDRLAATLEAAKFFEDLGCNVKIVISGGTVYKGINEAVAIYKFAQETFPEVNEFDITLERESENTAQNVNNIYRILKEKTKEERPKAVVPVSSPDHMPRVMREFVYHEGRPRIEETLILGCPSDKPHTKKGQEIPPAIIEPPVEFGEYNLAEMTPKFFKVPKDKRGEFAKELEELLKNYGAIE